MLASVLKKVFGSKNERVLKSIQPLVAAINQLEPEIQKLDDASLVAKTVLFKERLAAGVPLDSLLPEAFAVCREAAWRVLGMRHFDVQLVGGIILHQGKIAEMKTGEGKTLAATLPVYLNALTGRGVHVVTVNDYLARRDAEWMGKLYRFLGLSVGSILHEMDDAARKEAYGADITYGTNNEFGFDYLRDNMKFDLKDFCQREFHYAIVDEVDSILIDEARTPLIISGPAEMSTELYERADRIIPNFKVGEHYTLDEKARSVSLTEEGVALGEKLVGVDNLYDPRNIEWLHHLNQALKANVLFKRDVDYLVRDGQVVIVDEFTGRAMQGRRFSDGLHQALEAKERVKVERENQTLASITFQNYFRMYEKLAGMTGTADTEAAEFKKIYNLDVVIIPTHNTMIRKDYADVIYKNAKAKDRAIIREIQELHKKGQPVLVGTISIDVSEKISAMLKKAGVPHAVLNAKQHEKEAEIVADAGQKGKVTIATNMAGRGTDIKLGEGVTELGGLHILGTSRHESRRIDNQLRGRSGRQGDPGSSRFYLSLEDDLLRIFGSDRISGIMDKLGMEEDEPIEHTMISRAIENAQRKVEGHNFDIRKHLLEYDDVMNKQREVIYRQRREVLGSEDVHEVITDMFPELAEMVAGEFAEARIPSEEWDWNGVAERMFALFGFAGEWSEEEKKDLEPAACADLILAALTDRFAKREQEIGELNMRHLERVVLLQIVDHLWKEHLLNMDHLKEGIGLRGYGQKNPLDEYKKEGFNMFGEMINAVKTQTVSTLFRLQLVRDEEVAELEREQREQQQPMQLSRGAEGEDEHKPFSREGDKVGRNADCPCGSGLKYKRCCGKSSGKK
ncbi:MAG: preprotein translocase subunit SecA [Desulfurivibrionaceae bacterium]|nr:preprotein translocase subunit SecA [Pseudomonadota bacterium]MBU4229067.1 preprotein translocase subunit SecA [Pseudomonadota bacterium]MBU4413308.1 preprotein translocase subunit SecA [Pseudomonadota bacterium]MCG2823476.1 preprotein translocase subunit SecA [Desulfobulbaceae bacterium]MDP2001871.1 preprotein translocase subunit SecA [Desulfurivibrionaceae bacterium]